MSPADRLGTELSVVRPKGAFCYLSTEHGLSSAGLQLQGAHGGSDQLTAQRPGQWVFTPLGDCPSGYEVTAASSSLLGLSVLDFHETFSEQTRRVRKAPGDTQ